VSKVAPPELVSTKVKVMFAELSMGAPPPAIDATVLQGSNVLLRETASVLAALLVASISCK
jgi:hypothetical protein